LKKQREAALVDKKPEQDTGKPLRYVTVSLSVELDATATLSDRERQVQEAGREAMREAWKQAIRQSEEQRSACPLCGSKQRHGERNGA
jgi:hypothetical protein